MKLANYTPAATKRYTEVDSLRGLAALTVVFHHCLVMFPMFWSVYQTDQGSHNRTVDILSYSPIHLLWGGLEAVVVFYVLSGFVLAIPFSIGRPPSYAIFITKRICRIYIPYVVSIGAASLIINSQHTFGLSGASSWFNQFWSMPVGCGALLSHLLMLGLPQWNYINPVVWSLVHEMRVSLCFPLLMWLTDRMSPRIMILCFFVASTACKLLGRITEIKSVEASLFETGSYLFLFVAGIQLYRNRSLLQSCYRSLMPALKCLVIVADLAMINARWELPAHFQAISTTLIWLGAIGLLGIVIASQAITKALRFGILVWLGHVSYSLYLIHLVVLFTLVYTFNGILPLYIAPCITIPLSLMLAAFYHRFVEQPSTALGHELAARIKQMQERRRWRDSRWTVSSQNDDYTEVLLSKIEHH